MIFISVNLLFITMVAVVANSILEKKKDEKKFSRYMHSFSGNGLWKQ